MCHPRQHETTVPPNLVFYPTKPYAGLHDRNTQVSTVTHASGSHESAPIVIRFGRLGDMVLQTTLMHLLHARYGQPCRLITSGPWTGELLRGCADVAEIWELRRRHAPLLLSPERWRLALALRRCSGPIYISEDAPRQLTKIRTILRIARVAPTRCVFLADDNSPSVHWVDRLLAFGATTPPAFAEEYCPARPEDCWTAPRLTLNSDDRHDRDAWLGHRGISQCPIVLLQPGNKRGMKWGRARKIDSKAWPVEAWAKLLRVMHSDLPGARFLLCGSSNEESLLQCIRQTADLAGIEVVTRELPLRRLLALMEIAHSMISVDTGPSHMAAAIGCPLVVLYGAEPPAVWGRRSPFGKPVIELGGPPESRMASNIALDRVVIAWRGLNT